MKLKLYKVIIIQKFNNNLRNKFSNKIKKIYKINQLLNKKLLLNHKQLLIIKVVRKTKILNINLQ